MNLANICVQGNHKCKDDLTASSSTSSLLPSSSDTSVSLESAQELSALSSERDSPITYAAGERESQCESDTLVDPL